MRLRYTRPALADLDSILDHIRANSPQGEARVRARIEAIVNLLLSHPRIGVRTEDPNIRRINTSPHPYLIFYEIADDEIVIHAVRHGARDPSGMPGAGRPKR
jgi:plasmid stabilization system protein ParE